MLHSIHSVCKTYRADWVCKKLAVSSAPWSFCLMRQVVPLCSQLGAVLLLVLTALVLVWITKISRIKGCQSMRFPWDFMSSHFWLLILLDPPWYTRQDTRDQVILSLMSLGLWLGEWSIHYPDLENSQHFCDFCVEAAAKNQTSLQSLQPGDIHCHLAVWLPMASSCLGHGSKESVLRSE